MDAQVSVQICTGLSPSCGPAIYKVAMLLHGLMGTAPAAQHVCMWDRRQLAPVCATLPLWPGPAGPTPPPPPPPGSPLQLCMLFLLSTSKPLYYPSSMAWYAQGPSAAADAGA
jgi:hypothetical protein